MRRKARLDPSAIWGWLAFLVPLALFTASINASPAEWDTGEMETVPYILGISHQPGFPLFILTGWLFSHAVLMSSVAWRLSFMSAIAMAVAARAAFSAARNLDVPAPVAVGASWLFAFCGIVWTRGSRAEVHTFVAMFACIGLAAALRWQRTADPKAFFVLCASIGLGLATHLVELMFVPGLTLLAASRFRSVTPRMLGIGTCLLLLPLLAYAYIPLRAAYIVNHNLDPSVQLGLVGRPFWDNGDPSSLARYRDYLFGYQHDIGLGVLSIFRPATLLRAWQQYWPDLVAQFGMPALLAAGAGFLLELRDRPFLTAGLILAAFLAMPFVLNFPESDPERYYLGSLWLVSVYASVGTFRVARWLAETRMPRATTVLAAAVLGAFVGTLVQTNSAIWEQRGDASGDILIARVRDVTPDSAIILGNWLDSPTLAYGAYVERRLGNRIVVTGGPIDYEEHYEAWLKKRPIYVRWARPFAITVRGLSVRLVDVDSSLYAIEHTRLVPHAAAAGIRPVASPAGASGARPLASRLVSRPR